MSRRTTVAAACGLGAVALVAATQGAAATSPEAPSKYQSLFGASAAGPEFSTQSAPPEDIGANSVRVYGADRYETAVAISEFSWLDGEPLVVYLATGENYPDALAIGPSSFFLGPVLLTRPNVLPPDVAAELDRLDPCSIVIVGSDGVVSDAVALEADSYANINQTKCAP